MATQSIDRKIERARSIFQSKGKILLEDPLVSKSLTNYRLAIQETWAMMAQAGIPGQCAQCAGKTAGGCCFPEIGEEYDHILLLTNILMGCNLPDEHVVSGSCLFVGENGCKLLGRYYFCVNYLCPGLQQALGTYSCKKLLATVGAELQAGLLAEQSVRLFLSKDGSEAG